MFCSQGRTSWNMSLQVPLTVLPGFLPPCFVGLTLRKIPWFHLISWCGNFVERNSFRIVSGDSPETMWKLCLSTKFSHQEIRWNYGILRSVRYWKFLLFRDFPALFHFFAFIISFYSSYHFLFEPLAPD